MNTRTAIGILAVFTLTLSMAVLLPARADSIPPPGTPPTQFSVSGPAADQIQYQIFADETGEFNALQAGQIDLTDTPLNPPQVPIFCPTGVRVNHTSRVVQLSKYQAIRIRPLSAPMFLRPTLMTALMRAFSGVRVSRDF